MAIDQLCVPALIGPSACGKTEVALALARSFPLEIISVDSALVYRGMNIGTNKPSPRDLQDIPHHLINIIDPTDRYSVGRFVCDARNAIDEIVGRGNLPLIVGGTMLYYRALTMPLSLLPEADMAFRAHLDRQAMKYGWPALHAKLSRIDPITASRISKNDTHRIQRALEIFELTGRSISILNSEKVYFDLKPYRFLTLSLEPNERSWLHSRIEKRFNMMLEQDFLKEVQGLLALGKLHKNLPSMRCIGYRQALEYLNGENDFSSFQNKVIIATRQLCKKQMTWLRSIPNRVVLNCQSTDLLNLISKEIIKLRISSSKLSTDYIRYE